MVSTICPGSSDPFYIVNYCIKWVTTSWTHSSIMMKHPIGGVGGVGVRPNLEMDNLGVDTSCLTPVAVAVAPYIHVHTCQSVSQSNVTYSFSRSLSHSFTQLVIHS